MKDMAVYESITLLHILQEVRGIGKTCNQLSIKIALRAIEIANLLALNNAAQVPDTLQTLIDSLAVQPEDFKVTWTFNGTRHFIDHSAQLAPYRTWLGQLFTALEAEDRQTVLMDLQAARTGLQAVAK